MDGTRSGEGLTPEELAEVQRVYGLLREATDKEHRRLAELMVSKKDSELFGRTEFQIRDRVLRMGALALEAKRTVLKNTLSTTQTTETA